jgi:4'-phosphopantetheinyl transferase
LRDDHDWLPGPFEVELGAHEAHVWRASSTAPAASLPALWRILDGDERRRALRLPRGEARDTFITTRGTLRRVLAVYHRQPPADVPFRYGPLGKPTIADPRTDWLRFSVSHTVRLVVVAVAAGREVGVDIELPRPVRRPRRIARRIFATSTQQLLSTLDGAERVRAFHAAWTLREAYVKAIGAGVFHPGDPLPLVWPPAAPPHRREEVGSTRCWTVSALEPAPGYIGTVVVEGEAARIHQFDATPLQGE